MKRFAVTVALAALATLPLWVGNAYYVNIASQILLYAIFAIGLDEWTYRSYGGLGDRLILLACALAEGIGYRQLTTFWRLKGIWNSLRGRSESPDARVA